MILFLPRPQYAGDPSRIQSAIADSFLLFHSVLPLQVVFDYLLYQTFWRSQGISRDRPGTKFSRGRGRDQVESAGINRDFEMLPRPGPGPGLAKICRDRGWDFFNLILKIFESFRKLVSM